MMPQFVKKHKCSVLGKRKTRQEPGFELDVRLLFLSQGEAFGKLFVQHDENQ